MNGQDVLMIVLAALAALGGWQAFRSGKQADEAMDYAEQMLAFAEQTKALLHKLTWPEWDWPERPNEGD